LYKIAFLIHIQALPNNSYNKVVGHFDLFVSSVETNIFVFLHFLNSFRIVAKICVLKDQMRAAALNLAVFGKFELCLRKLSRKFARKFKNSHYKTNASETVI
jgi:hypothetical protein